MKKWFCFFCYCVISGVFLNGCGVKASHDKVSSNVGEIHNDPGFHPAVSLEEVMTTYPSPGEYIAFSLKVAQKQLEKIKMGKNYSRIYPEIFNLGGINQIHGLVYDRHLQDLILVGKYELDRQPITLDDFVVALRARFIHGKWPLVSIDPEKDTMKSEIQLVRFEGGIENSQFGYDLFFADYRLKQMAIGQFQSGLPSLKSELDYVIEESEAGLGDLNVRGRSWFAPFLPSVTIRENVIAIKDVKVRLFTEVQSAQIMGENISNIDSMQDSPSERFTSAINLNFQKLALENPSFGRLQGLTETVALTAALEQWEETPDLEFWLNDYVPKKIETKAKVKIVNVKKTFVKKTSGEMKRFFIEMSGGVHLRAIALRLDAGDVTALKDAVLAARPNPHTQSWKFLVGEWIIPMSMGDIKNIEALDFLLNQAAFLGRKNEFDSSLALYNKILELKKDWAIPYNNRGVVFLKKDNPNKAIQDFDSALRLNPRFVEAMVNRGIAHSEEGEYGKALADFNQALKINQNLADAYYNRGNLYAKMKQNELAIQDFSLAIGKNPRLESAFNNRGMIFQRLGRTDRAIQDYDEAIRINSEYPDAFLNRGMAYRSQSNFQLALLDYNRAAQLNPTYVNTFHNRGILYLINLKDYKKACSDFKRACTLGLCENYTLGQAEGICQ